MTTNKHNMRHIPSTTAAEVVVELLSAYQDAVTAAHGTHKTLSDWGVQFSGVVAGDIVEAGKRLNASGCYVRTISVSGPFNGWSGNRMRMLVDSVSAQNDATALSPLPTINVLLTGTPIKDDGTPFGTSTCQAVIEIIRQAIDSDCDSGAGYAGYEFDAIARFVDKACLPSKPAGKTRR